MSDHYTASKHCALQFLRLPTIHHPQARNTKVQGKGAFTVPEQNTEGESCDIKKMTALVSVSTTQKSTNQKSTTENNFIYITHTLLKILKHREIIY